MRNGARLTKQVKKHVGEHMQLTRKTKALGLGSYEKAEDRAMKGKNPFLKVK